LPLRQLGDQEINIVDIVKSITKYAVMVTEPSEIRYHLEKAMYLATHGRPAPVWLDIPLDVQSAIVDETKLKSYKPFYEQNYIAFNHDVDNVIEKLIESERPVILAGAGIRLSGATEDFYQLAERIGVPIQVAWGAIDLFPSTHPLYAGRPSTVGQRGANFIFQNADLLLSIGCRLNVRQIGYTFKAVARAAYKISVEIDPAELKKPTLEIDLPINADAKEFIHLLNIRLKDIPKKTAWLVWCKERINRYPLVLPEYYQSKSVNPYVFCDVLSKKLRDNEIIVSSNGSACVIPIQTMQIKKGQRHIVNSGSAAMGYGLPAAIGACFASGKRVICLEGDGSIQMNIQELETVKYHRLPLKIFVFNNGAYLSMRFTQGMFFNGRMVGESAESGVGFPNFGKIANAYGIDTYHINHNNELDEIIDEVLKTNSPVLCNVAIDADQTFMPRITSKQLKDGRMVSSPLEDMYPFLGEEEFMSNMLIPRWEN
jgi:acetolactate synthase-1/2/3 large subunit